MICVYAFCVCEWCSIGCVFSTWPLSELLTTGCRLKKHIFVNVLFVCQLFSSILNHVVALMYACVQLPSDHSKFSQAPGSCFLWIPSTFIWHSGPSPIIKMYRKFEICQREWPRRWNLLPHKLIARVSCWRDTRESVTMCLQARSTFRYE